MSASQTGAGFYAYHGEMWKLPDPSGRGSRETEETVSAEPQAWEEADTRLYQAIDRVMQLQQKLRESQEHTQETLERLIRLLTP